MSMDKAKHEAIRIYLPLSYHRTQMTISLFGLITATLCWWILIPMTIQTGSLSDFFFTFLGGIFLIYLCIHLYLNVFQARLLIFNEGIEYQRGNMRLFVRWENLKNFAVYKNGVYIRFYLNEYKEVHHRVEQIFNLPLRKSTLSLEYFLSPYYQWAWLLKRKLDFDKLKQTPLGADLYRYAPQLFKEDKPTAQ